jgi:hypothetical protein
VRGVSRATLIRSVPMFANEPVPVTDRRTWMRRRRPTPSISTAWPSGSPDSWPGCGAGARHDGHGAAIGWPTSELDWTAWALPAFPQPVVIRCADSTPVPALAAADLTAAVLAALDRDGGFDVFHILGDDGSGWASSGWASDNRRCAAADGPQGLAPQRCRGRACLYAAQLSA